MPPRKGSNKPFHAMRTHWINSGIHPCQRRLDSFGKWQGLCGYCELYQWLWQKGLTNETRMIKPLERFLCNIIARDYSPHHPNHVIPNAGPFVYAMGKTLHTMVINVIVGDPVIARKPLGDITAYKTGRDFKIKRNLVGGNYPSYIDSLFLEESVAGTTEEWERWMASLHELDKVFKKEDPVVVKNICDKYMSSCKEPVKSVKVPKFRSIDEGWEC